MGNDITSQTANNADGGYVQSEEVLLCHFFGLAYPKTPATTAPRIER